MRPQVVSATGNGASTVLSDPIIVNYRQNNFKIGLAVNVTPPVTYTVQHTLDDPYSFSSTSDFNNNATWFSNDIADLVGATGNQDGNIFFPVRAVRLSLEAASTGTATLTVLQGNAT
jgi:hypothetical protein